MTTTGRSERITVGEVELYAEVVGSGPVVLLVPGAAGDGGQYAELAANSVASTRW